MLQILDIIISQTGISEKLKNYSFLYLECNINVSKSGNIGIFFSEKISFKDNMFNITL